MFPGFLRPCTFGTPKRQLKITFPVFSPPVTPSKGEEEEEEKKNAPAVMHVPLFTLCLQFAFHILRPRPRCYAGLRDKSHTQKGRERESERWGGGGVRKRYGEMRRERAGGGWGGLTLFTAMQLRSTFEPSGVLWQPLWPPLSVL